MGASNSTTMTNETTNDVVNTYMQDIQTNVENSNTAEMSLTQELDFRMPFSSIDNCDIFIGQTQKATMRSTMDAVASITTEQAAELETQIANAQSQALTQANEDLACCTSNEANTENEINNNVSNTVQTAVESTFSNMNYTSGTGVQTATIDLEGLSCVDSDLVITQNQAMDIVAQNLSETIADIVQDGEIVTDIVNEQTQVVTQKNTGMGMSSSGSSSSCCVSIIVSAVLGGLAAASGQEGGALTETLNPKVSTDIKLPDKIEDIPKEVNWKITALLATIGLIILGLIIYYVYSNTPKYVCPSEDDCSRGWDEMKAEAPAISGAILQKYHNCRIRHRARGIKPQNFRPTCETYCAYLEREESTPGMIKPNPFIKWLYCFNLMDMLTGGDEETTEEDDSGGDETDPEPA